MTDPKNDASTNIEELAQRMVDSMNRACAELRANRLDQAAAASRLSNAALSCPKELPNPVYRFKVGRDKAASRTPAEQAALVSKGTSWVCWSAHLADRARDINMFMDGKYLRSLTRAVLGNDLQVISDLWLYHRRMLGLKNAKGEDSWSPGDPLHVELPQSKPALDDPRALACLKEYARLTRGEGRRRNESFEANYRSVLAPHLVPYEQGRR